MPATVQQIQLAGAAEIAAQLAQIGQAGQAAFQSLGQAALQASGGLQGIGDAADKAHKKTAEGGKQAGASLFELGNKGKEAFEGLSRSAEGFLGSLSQLSAGGLVGAFEGLAGTLGNVAGAFGPVGKAVELFVGGIGAAVAGTGALTFGLFELTKSSSETIVGLDNLAKEAGTAFEDIVGMKSAFAATGVSSEEFGLAMKRIAIRMQTDWPDIARAVRDASDSVERDQIKIREATIAASGADDLRKSTVIATQEALINASRAERNEAEAAIAVKEAALRQDQAHNAVADARLSREAAAHSVAEAEYNLQVALTGQRDKDVEHQLRIEGAEQAVAQAKQHQIDISHQVEQAQLAERKAALDYANALDQQKRATLEAQKAQIDLHNAQRQQAEAGDRSRLLQLDLSAAQKKADDDRAKSIPGIADTLDRAGKGQADRQKDVNLSLVQTADLYKAIELNASQREGGLTGKNVILELATAFQALGNSAEANAKKLAVVREIGLRGAGQELVNALNQGPKKIGADIDENRGVGKQIADQVEGAHKFEEANAKLRDELSRTVTLGGATFFQDFNDGLEKFSATLGKNRQDIIDWAAGLKGVHGLITDVFAVLSGAAPAEGGFVSGLVKVKDAIIGIKDALVEVVALVKQFTGSDVGKVIAPPPGSSHLGQAFNAIGEASGFNQLVGINQGNAERQQGGPVIDQARGAAPEDYVASVRAAQKRSATPTPYVGESRADFEARQQAQEAPSGSAYGAGTGAAPPPVSRGLLDVLGQFFGLVSPRSGAAAAAETAGTRREEAPKPGDNDFGKSVDTFKGAVSAFSFAADKSAQAKAETAPSSARSSVPSDASASPELHPGETRDPKTGTITAPSGFQYDIRDGRPVAHIGSVAETTAFIYKHQAEARAKDAADEEAKKQAARQQQAEDEARDAARRAQAAEQNRIRPSLLQPLTPDNPFHLGLPLGAQGPGVRYAPGDIAPPVGVPIAPAPGPRSETTQGIGDALKTAIADAGQAFKDAITQPTQGAPQGAGEPTNILSSGQGAISDFVKALSDASTQIRQFTSSLAAPSGGHALGGLLSGPGTGTSDGILGRFSSGEFVVRADGSNLGDAIQHFTKGYADGGLIDSAFSPPETNVPSFAKGDDASSSQHHSVDLTTNLGTWQVQATPDTVASMKRAAVNARLVSAGTRPSAYK